MADRSATSESTESKTNVKRKISERGFFFREGGRGEPPYPPYHKKTRLSRGIFDANFLEKDLAKPRFNAYAVRMKIEMNDGKLVYQMTSEEHNLLLRLALISIGQNAMLKMRVQSTWLAENVKRDEEEIRKAWKMLIG